MKSIITDMIIPYCVLAMLSLPVASCNVAGNDNLVEKCFLEAGIASWYGSDFHGEPTASGEIYDMETLTAAHKTLPFNTIVRVVNLDNKKTVTVRINNRGPFVEGRVIDLSRKAAREIDILEAGLAEVELYLVKEGDSPPENFRCNSF